MIQGLFLSAIASYFPSAVANYKTPKKFEVQGTTFCWMDLCLRDEGKY